MSDVVLDKSPQSQQDSSNAHSSDFLSGITPSVDPFKDSFEEIDFSSVSLTALDNNPEIDFFAGGDRRAVLDELMHLCQFSNNLVAVLGEAGVGKTSLAYQAAIEFSDTAQCCLIQSSVMMSNDDVFLRLAKQLGIFIPDGASLDEVISTIAHAHPPQNYPRVVIVIDDAHHLHPQVLSSLMLFLQQQPSNIYHILLVGDSSLLLRLDELDKGEILVYDIPLCPFTIDELEQYLTFKMSVVGYEGAEVFDYDTVQSIWRDTHGIAASVNRIAGQLLLSQSMSEDDNKLGLPITYMLLIVVLLAALILSVFYVGDEISTPSSIEELAAADSVIQEPVQVDDVKDAAVTEEIASDQDNVPLDPLVVEEALPVQEESAELPGDSGVQENVEPTGSPALQSSPNEQDKVVSADSTIVDEPLPQSEAVSTEEVVAEEPVALVSESSTSELAITAAPANPVLLTQDEEAVLFWPEEGYTLQVIAAGRLDSVQKFVDEQVNRQVLRIIRFKRNEAPWYVVLTGVYSSSEEARLAINLLPDEQIAGKPWARKISDVHAKIEEFKRR